MFVVYSEAVIKFFKRLKWLGQSVPVVYAGPDRAHAMYLHWWAKREASKTGKSVEQIKKTSKVAALPRPFISTFLTLAGFDANRYSPFVHRKVAVDLTEGTALSVQEPRPENMTVQADIWCGDDWRCADDLVFQLKSMFNADDTPLFVNFDDPKYYTEPYGVAEFCKLLGKITCRLTDEGVSDGSQYSGSRESAKEVRKTFSGTLYGWLPRMPYKGKLVHELKFSVKAKDGGTVEDLDDFTIEFPK